MSVKSTVIASVQKAAETYEKGLKDIANLYTDPRYSENGRHEGHNGILEKVNQAFDESAAKVATLLADVSQIYTDRDAARSAKVANDANYQVLLSAALSQLPTLRKCSDQVIRARFEMFAEDPVANEMMRAAFIENEVPLSLLPGCTVGRAAEMAQTVGEHVKSRLDISKRAASNEYDGLVASIVAGNGAESVSGSGEKVRIGAVVSNELQSMLAYLEGLNEDCTDFDPSKVDQKMAGWEIMNGHDYAGQVSKKYGGQEMADVTGAGESAGTGEA